jgi:hypothetical protein
MAHGGNCTQAEKQNVCSSVCCLANVLPVELPCRAWIPSIGKVEGFIVSRYWIEDRGWFADVEYEAVAGFPTIAQVPLAAVEGLAGVDYAAIKPKWFMRSRVGLVAQDHPPP